MRKIFVLSLAVGLVMSACSEDDVVAPTPPDDSPVQITSGSADFSNYVALGNSLTAGFSDNALFIDGQEASFPNMLASNFAMAGGGAFNIPFMADNLGGATFGGEPVFGNRLFLAFLPTGPAPTPVPGMGTTDIGERLAGPFNNMGVPGARSFELLAEGYGSQAALSMGLANPYFVRFASGEGASVIGDAVDQNPTFFTALIGSNDVLLYATSGGTGVDRTNDPTPPADYNRNDITNPEVYAGVMTGILQQMTANGAGGAIANLADVTSLPFFTTVPHNPVPLDEATATLLNGPMGFGAYNAGIAQLQMGGVITEDELQRRTISFSPGEGNAVVILDEDLTDLTGFNPALLNIRQATPEDLLVLTARTFIGTLADPNNPASANGIAVPLGDQWVLTPEEQTAIADATAAYNATIAALADQFNLAFVDTNALLRNVAENGFPLADGSIVTDTFATGGGFSLDGVHPSPRGYAILANAFVEAINATYGSNLPGVEPLNFTGLYIQ